MSTKVILVADSLVDTIEFDVISTDTKDPIKVNGVATKPVTDFLLMPTGIGFKQTLDIVTGDTIDYIIKQTINKKNIKLTILWKGPTAYAKYQSFATWIARYFDLTKYHLRFSYDVTGTRRYVEVAAINLELTGRDGRNVTATLDLQPLTPFYEEVSTSFIVNDTNVGKIYDYAYPYIYGGGAFSGGNSIKNEYLKDIPLKIILKGPMATPYVSITKVKEDGVTLEDTPYGRVMFAGGVSITANETITIDAFNSKIYITSVNPTTGAITITDAFNSVNKIYDSFLLAEPGTSRIAASLDSTSAECRIFYVRYVL